MSKCYFCNSDVNYSDFQDKNGILIHCQICGDYRIIEITVRELQTNEIQDSYIYSAIIRENNLWGIIPTIRDLASFRESIIVPADPLSCIDRFLLFLQKSLTTYDSYVEVNRTNDYPIAYAKSPQELQFLIAKSHDLGYIENDHTGPKFRLTLEGWKRASNLTNYEKKSTQAFVAMWFNENVQEAWDHGLKAALNHLGFQPIRIDQKEYNGKICDQIIAEIRKSGLLIADFTGQRNGVYFEAGFAMGLGIPVIWTCREDDVNNLHFDTRQYNHIVWKDAADLKSKLIARIEATIPNRPQQHS